MLKNSELKTAPGGMICQRRVFNISGHVDGSPVYRAFREAVIGPAFMPGTNWRCSRMKAPFTGLFGLRL